MHLHFLRVIDTSLGTVSELFYIKHYDWFIMISSRISLVYLKNYQISSHIITKMVEIFSNEPMKFLMTSLWTNQNALCRIIWRQSLREIFFICHDGKQRRIQLCLCFVNKACFLPLPLRLILLLPLFTNTGACSYYSIEEHALVFKIQEYVLISEKTFRFQKFKNLKFSVMRACPSMRGNMVLLWISI